MSIPVTREFTTGPGFTSRLAWAQLRSSFRAWTVLPIVLVTLLMLGLAVFGIVQQQSGTIIYLVYPVIMVALVGFAFLITRRQVESLTPQGSLYTVTRGAETIVVGIGSTTAEVPYGTYSRVDRVGEFVALRFRTTNASLLLPAELFPDDEFNELGAAVADPAAATAVLALSGGLGTGLDHEYVTDAAFVPRLARSALIRAFLRGPMIVILVIITGLGLLMLLGGLLGLILVGTGGIPLSEVGPMFGAAAFFLGFTALIVFGSYLLIRRQLGKVIPVGSVYGIGFGERTLTMRGPVNSAELPYSSYKIAKRRGHFVELIGTRGNGRVTLPAQLFPSGALEHLNALLAR